MNTLHYLVKINTSSNRHLRKLEVFLIDDRDSTFQKFKFMINGGTILLFFIHLDIKVDD